MAGAGELRQDSAGAADFREGAAKLPKAAGDEFVQGSHGRAMRWLIGRFLGRDDDEAQKQRWPAARLSGGVPRWWLELRRELGSFRRLDEKQWKPHGEVAAAGVTGRPTTVEEPGGTAGGGRREEPVELRGSAITEMTVKLGRLAMAAVDCCTELRFDCWRSFKAELKMQEWEDAWEGKKLEQGGFGMKTTPGKEGNRAN